MTPYEQSIRENLPPPGHDIREDRRIDRVFRAWAWIGPDGKQRTGYESRRAACLAAWAHFEAGTA